MADKLPQHPFVQSVKADPSQPAKKSVVLTGLPGNSDRPDYQRLYLTTALDYYAEFPVAAILKTQAVPADQSPIPGQEATQVTISRDATIRYVTETSPQPIDEFDLDVRLGALSATAPILGTRIGGGPGGTCETCITQCDDGTRCLGTCRGHTCIHTACQQATCLATQCQQGTCVNTQCNQNTCHTCQTQCNQNTCHTCHTQCNQVTCGNANTCLGTCLRTCATCCGHPNTCV